MQLEISVRGETVTELEANARAEVDKVADGRDYTLKIEHAHARTDDRPLSPVARMSAGYGSAALSGYATATFADKAPAASS